MFQNLIKKYYYLAFDFGITRTQEIIKVQESEKKITDALDSLGV